MIQIWKRNWCSFCPVVMKYLDKRAIPYEVFEAEGDEYKELAGIFGVSVPLVYNTESREGMVGYAIAKLNKICKVYDEF